MRHFSAICCLLISGPLVYAAGPKTPYEAVVTAENASLHAGPKKDKFYTTGMIPQGTVVVVHRHDPGGWFMIEPPPGSFSWIPAKLVERNGEIGTVTANNVRVQVGTPDSDRHDVSQRRLNAGDEVQILGQKVLDVSPTGEAQVWYQITPPAYEWRWVMGRNVTPIDQVATPISTKPTPQPAGRATERTPLRAPQPVADGPVAQAEPREPVAGTAFNNYEEPEGDVAEPYTVSQAGGESEQAEAPLEAPSILAALDEEFARILELDAGQQDFAALEAGYRDARHRADNPATQRLIDRRLATLRSLSQEAAAARVFQDEPAEQTAELDEAQRIDQELAARQAEIEARLAGVQHMSQRLAPQPAAVMPSRQPTSLQPTPAVSPLQPTPQIQPGILPQPVPAVSSPNQQVHYQAAPRSGHPSPIQQAAHAQQVQPGSANPRMLLQPPTRKLHPRFDGAGIIQAAPAGAPAPYLLTAKDGRVLAFLYPEAGVHIQAFVGKPAGIHGARSFSNEIRADQIRVTGLEPVRLQ